MRSFALKNKMTRWMINTLYVAISMVISVAVIAASWLTFFVNPINWKNYTEYRTGDRILMWGSNSLIVILAVIIIAATWIGFGRIRKKWANHVQQGIR